MNPVTHFLTGWGLANCTPSLDREERAMVALASVVPDVDGLGAIVDLATRNSAHPTEWFSWHHHQLHCLAFAIPVATGCFVLARRRWLTGLLVLLSFHLHLLEDLLVREGRMGTSGRSRTWHRSAMGAVDVERAAGDCMLGRISR